MTALALQTAPTHTISSAIERITVRDAERFLARNRHNRALKAGAVRRLASAIRRGEWELNGESIKFSTEGDLLDGQHRLQAVVEAGRPIESLVIRGLPASAQDTVDIGAKRTAGDILRLRGFGDYNYLAGVLTYYHRIVTGQVRSSGPEYQSPTPQELLELLSSHPDIVESMTVAGRVRSRLRVSKSQMAALHYHFRMIDPEDADSFFSALETGENLNVGSPVYALRRWVEQTAAVSRRGASHTIVHAVTVKCWNAFRRNEEMKVARWRGAIEEFPEAI